MCQACPLDKYLQLIQEGETEAEVEREIDAEDRNLRNLLGVWLI